MDKPNLKINKDWKWIEEELARHSFNLSLKMLDIVHETELGIINNNTKNYENLKNAFLLLDMVNLMVQKSKQIPEKLMNELKDKINNLQVK